MRRRITRRAMGVLLIGWLTLNAWALDVPPFTGLLIDRAAMLSAGDRERVTARLDAFTGAGSGQMAILIVPSLEGEAIEAFGIRVGDAWKVGGQEKDDGLILIVSRDDHAMRVEVGYGLEGVINDARAGDVLRAMGPAFREGRYADGLILAVDQLEGYVRPRTAATDDSAAPAGAGRSSLPFPVALLILVAFVLLVNLLNRRFGGSRGGRRGGGFSGGGGGRFGGGGASGKW